jgi:hypothetical protein
VQEAQGVEEATHHRTLMPEVVRDEHPGRHDLRNGRHGDQLARLFLERHRLNALETELDALRNERQRLGLFRPRRVVTPERLGGRDFAVGIELLPQLRGHDGQVRHETRW